jgi:hypothetical protein
VDICHPSASSPAIICEIEQRLHLIPIKAATKITGRHAGRLARIATIAMIAMNAMADGRVGGREVAARLQIWLNY